MSLSARVTAAVNKAFTAAGDLVKTGTLSTKNVSGYDFATRSTVSTTGSQSVDVIIQSTQKPSGDAFTITALMKTGVDLSVYDTLTVNNKAYNIIDYSDNGFTIEAILTKEVS
jgi:hypothetical protein